MAVVSAAAETCVRLIGWMMFKGLCWVFGLTVVDDAPRQNGARAMRIGFVGLGDQGGPMPLRLLEAGHDVTIWARRPDACAPFVEAGAKVAPDLQTLGQQSDWIGICVFDDAGVRQVCEAIMPHMQPGGTIVVHSTVHPDTCRELATRAAANGLACRRTGQRRQRAGARRYAHHHDRCE